MSIQSEITRLRENVSNALQAISAKGVTVPEGANSDDLAALIGQIETGGLDVDYQYGKSEATSFSSGQTKNIDITFPQEFAEAPVVVVTMERPNSVGVTVGSARAATLGITTTGFRARVTNEASSTYSYCVNWVAYGSR